MKFKSRRTKGRKQDSLQFERLEDRQLMAAVITVNSTLENNVRDNFLTLREAILVNNRALAVTTLTAAEQAQVSGIPTSTDTDTIGFNIPGAGVQSITPTSNLPSITDPAIIDGYTQPGASANTLVVGSNAVPLIELVGGSGPGSGLVISANNTTVRGLVIHSFGSAIYVQSGGNTIEGNWLGIDDDGNTRLANVYDVFVANSPAAANNLIGGTTSGSRNVMAGTANQNAGIMLFPGGGSATIQGNYIGMNAQGTDGIGASGRIYLGTPGNLVGGTAPGSGNVISGRAIEVYASGNTIQGNTFGLNASGSATLANNLNGIIIAGNSIPTDNNLIGGTTPEARNVFATSGTAIDVANSSGPNVGNRIQGNYFGTNRAGTAPAGAPSVSGTAIRLNGGMNNLVGGTTPGAGNVITNFVNGYGIEVLGSNNTIQGNRIGTNAAGTTAIPNGAGIYINSYVSNTVIGGNSTAAANVISGNLGNGILIAPGGTFNTVQGNLIGVAADGFSPLGNGTTGGVANRNGIRVEGTDNLIGGAQPGEGNTIAFHGGSGVLLPLTFVLPNSGLRNSVLGNSIHSNSGLGIDIYGGGVTLNDLNDADAGPNDVQNFPVLGSALTFGASTTIQGTLNSIANSTFLVEFFSNPTADPTGFGEGQTYLGSAMVATDGSGNGSFSFNTAVAVPVGHFISSTATGAAGNTSEFSGVRAVTSPPTISINDVSATEGVSGITAFTFTVTLSANPSSNVTVMVNTANGTTNPATTADNDYSAINNLVLTFVPNGPLTQTVTVNVVGDSKFERDETFFVNLSSPTGATIADGQGLGSIQNDDLAPTLAFSSNNSVLEGNLTSDDRKVLFTVTLSAVSGVDVSGTISTTSGTATEGSDFVSSDGVAFVIPAGQTQATILVSVIEDTTFEPDEQFTIEAGVSDPTTVSNSIANGTGTILNDDAPPTLSINDVTANEGISGITSYTFTVTLSASPSSNVTVTVNTADGTTNPATTADNDYSAISNLVLTFVPNGPLTQTVTVDVTGDSKFERDETFFVNLSSPTGATIADGQGLGTIQNDDLAPTLVFSTNNSVLEGNVTADDRKVPFTITLSAVSGVDVTGTINTTTGTATEGTDFASADGVAFLIPAGQTQATVLVSVIEDTTFEADEQFTITATAADLTSVSNSGGTASGTGTIENDDTMATFSIDDISLTEGVSGITAFTFTVTLSANPSSNVTVTVNTANGTTNPATTADNDYSAISNLVLTFVPNGPLTQTVTVNVSGDSKFERNETFFVNLSSPTGATLGDNLGLGTILNDDLAPTISFSANNSVLEGNVTADDRKVPFTITLSAVSGVDVTGTINTSSGSATEGTDFVSADGVTFTIPAGQTQATVLVSVIEDTTFEADEQFTITATAADLTSVSNSGGTASGIGTIQNDDVLPTLVINNVSANEGVSGITAFTFTVTLSANPSSNVSVTVNTANGTTNPATTADNDYSAISNLVLTFVPNGPLTQTVTVNVTGDSKFERNETFFVNLSSPTGATLADGQGLGTILNDDLAPTISFSTNNSVLEGNVTADDRKVPFTITLSAVSGVDVTGTINTFSGTATEGTDFVNADGVAFLIPAGQTQATVLVSVIEDTTFEADEQFTIDAAVSDPSTVSNSIANGTGTILNDDAPPTLIINNVSANEGVSGITAFTFTVTLSANPSSNVTITVNTANGTSNPATTADNDYSAVSNLVLTFVPNGPLTQTVTVNVAGDSKFERNETFFVNLSSPTGATIADGQGLGTILNDDLAPTISFSTNNSVLEGNVTADDRKVPFTITLSAVSGVDVTGTINTASGTATEGTDFVSADGVTFTIPAGQTQATILVSVIEDTTVETNETLTITATAADLTTVSNASGQSSGTGTIQNDDSGGTAPVKIGGGCSGPALIINGSSANDIIRVVAQGQSAVNVLINGQSYGPFTLSSFEEIIVYGKNGNDDIELASTITKRAFLFGEGGNDRLKGGNGPNILVGGNGCDNLIGSQAADVLIGGDGSDTLVGNGGDDLLIAGWTDHDTNLAALCAVLDEWARTDTTYSSRVTKLRNGGGLNGSVRLNCLTVHDDGDFDRLTGSAGRDWYFANIDCGVLDQITDKHSTEWVDDID